MSTFLLNVGYEGVGDIGTVHKLYLQGSYKEAIEDNPL